MAAPPIGSSCWSADPKIAAASKGRGGVPSKADLYVVADIVRVNRSGLVQSSVVAECGGRGALQCMNPKVGLGGQTGLRVGWPEEQAVIRACHPRGNGGRRRAAVVPQADFEARCRKCLYSKPKLEKLAALCHPPNFSIHGDVAYDSGDWNRKKSREFPTRVGVVAESHASHNTEDPLVSPEVDGVSANMVPGFSEDERWRIVKDQIAGLLSNAQKHSRGMHQVRHSLGVDFGDVKTGVSISLKGFAPRPLRVVRMRGDKLIEQLLDIATREKADEFIVGLPRSSDGKETVQSNKTRSFAGRLAGQAALRGWRVYLQDEYGSSQGGLDYMLEMGVKKRSRKEMIDAYAAVVLLSSYFNSKGAQAQLVVPKGLPTQERLCLGSSLSAEEKPGRVEVYDFDEYDNYEYED